VHAAVRLNGTKPPAEGFVALSRSARGAVEVYGESRSKPAFSAEFDLAAERAAAVALSELRLPPDTAFHTLEELLPKPAVNPVANDLGRDAMPYVAALSGACPRLRPAANLLPPEHRRLNSRAVFVPTMVLAAFLLLVAGSMLAYGSWSERQYLKQINSEIAKLEPARKRAEALERDATRAQARALLLDEFRKRTRKDLDAMNELTRLLVSPAWSNNFSMARDTVRFSGEANQTAPLLKILDSSLFFEKTEIQMSTPRVSGEAFQIRTNRRRGK
jgi:hypothetical protein